MRILTTRAAPDKGAGLAARFARRGMGAPISLLDVYLGAGAQAVRKELAARRRDDAILNRAAFFAAGTCREGGVRMSDMPPTAMKRSAASSGLCCVKIA